MNFIQHRGLGNGNGKNSKSTARTCALTWIVAAAFATGAGVPPAMHGAHEQSATWNGATSDFNNGLNWTPQTVPANTATFDGGGALTVTFSNNFPNIDRLLFSSSSQYQFDVAAGQLLTIDGEGIVLSPLAATPPRFAVAGILDFRNSATAGDAVIVNNDTSSTRFFDNSTAGTADIDNRS